MVLKIETAIDIYLDRLLAKLESADLWGMKINIADLQSLMNIRYRILADDQDGSSNNLSIIFQDAFNKYGIRKEPARLSSPVLLQNPSQEDNPEKL